MSDYSELKRRAEEILEIERVYPCGSSRVILVNPAAVLALIAEVEQLKGQIRLSKTAMEMAIHDANGRHVTDSMRDRMEIERQDKEIQALRKDAESWRAINANS